MVPTMNSPHDAIPGPKPPNVGDADLIYVPTAKMAKMAGFTPQTWIDLGKRYPKLGQQRLDLFSNRALWYVPGCLEWLEANRGKGLVDPANADVPAAPVPTNPPATAKPAVPVEPVAPMTPSGQKPRGPLSPEHRKNLSASIKAKNAERKAMEAAVASGKAPATSAPATSGASPAVSSTPLSAVPARTQPVMPDVPRAPAVKLDPELVAKVAAVIAAMEKSPAPETQGG